MRYSRYPLNEESDNITTDNHLHDLLQYDLHEFHFGKGYICDPLCKKNSLMLEVHKAGFHREGHILCYLFPLFILIPSQNIVFPFTLGHKDQVSF